MFWLFFKKNLVLLDALLNGNGIATINNHEGRKHHECEMLCAYFATIHQLNTNPISIKKKTSRTLKQACRVFDFFFGQQTHNGVPPRWRCRTMAPHCIASAMACTSSLRRSDSVAKEQGGRMTDMSDCLSTCLKMNNNFFYVSTCIFLFWAGVRVPWIKPASPLTLHWLFHAKKILGHRDRCLRWVVGTWPLHACFPFKQSKSQGRWF